MRLKDRGSARTVVTSCPPRRGASAETPDGAAGPAGRKYHRPPMTSAAVIKAPVNREIRPISRHPGSFSGRSRTGQKKCEKRELPGILRPARPASPAGPIAGQIPGLKAYRRVLGPAARISRNRQINNDLSTQHIRHLDAVRTLPLREAWSNHRPSPKPA